MINRTLAVSAIVVMYILIAWSIGIPLPPDPWFTIILILFSQLVLCMNEAKIARKICIASGNTDISEVSITHRILNAVIVVSSTVLSIGKLFVKDGKWEIAQSSEGDIAVASIWGLSNLLVLGISTAVIHDHYVALANAQQSQSLPLHNVSVSPEIPADNKQSE